MKRARLGFIGAGWWATQNHIPVAVKTGKAELSAVCRLGAEELERVRGAFGFAHAFESVDELLEKVPLDGAIITSPHGLHYAHARKALEAGLHVLVEKPMATSAHEARELVALGRRVNRHILVPNGWNFRPYLLHARSLIQGGAVGRIRHVAMQMASPAEALFSGQPYPGTESNMYRPPASTWADPANFGGYGWGQLPHLLGCLFRITELKPQSVFALAGESSTGVDLYNAAAIRFAEGATGSLSGAGSVPMNSPFQVDIRIFGSEGMLLLDLERERLVVRRNDDANQDYAMEPGAGAYECEEPVRRFVDLCLGLPVSNEAPGEVGMRAIEVIDALYRSIHSGKLEGV
ncbi:MAG: Gfo/Idh/MocA family oxidoreductase [Gammaproteobacteria bacterium]